MERGGVAMDRDKQLFFAYLTAWAVDNIITAIYNTQPDGRSMKLNTTEQLVTVANGLVDSWEVAQEESLD